MRLRLTNGGASLVIVELSGRYTGGPVAEGGFAESYGPFLQALPAGTFDIVVSGTFNSGAWQHTLRVVNGGTQTMDYALAPSPPVNIVPWTVQP